MHDLVTFIREIPSAVWSGLLGALIALAGVVVSNRGSTARLRVQLAHEAKEGATERTAALRREVYLTTAEELVKANAHLATLPELDPAITNLGDGLQGFFGAAARLQLVAEPGTAVLVSRLTSRYGDLLLQVPEYLLPSASAKTDIRISDDHYKQAHSEVQRVLAEMARVNESGIADETRFLALNRSFEFFSSRANEYAVERAQAWTRYNEATTEYHRFVLLQFKEIAALQIPLLVAIRNDLGLSGDLSALELELNKQRDRLIENYEKLIAKLSDA